MKVITSLTFHKVAVQNFLNSHPLFFDNIVQKKTKSVDGCKNVKMFRTLKPFLTTLLCLLELLTISVHLETWKMTGNTYNLGKNFCKLSLSNSERQKISEVAQEDRNFSELEPVGGSRLNSLASRTHFWDFRWLKREFFLSCNSRRNNSKLWS